MLHDHGWQYIKSEKYESWTCRIVGRYLEVYHAFPLSPNQPVHYTYWSGDTVYGNSPTLEKAKTQCIEKFQEEVHSYISDFL